MLNKSIFLILLTASALSTAGHGSEAAVESIEEQRAQRVRKLEKLLTEVQNEPTATGKSRQLFDIAVLLEDKDLRRDSVAPRVRPLITDRSPAVRRGAVTVLGRIEDGGAIEELRTITVADPDSSVRRVAIDVLAMTAKEDSVPHIKRLLQDPDMSIQLKAAGALGYLGDESGFEVANRMLTAEDTRVRDLAASALGEIGRPESVQAIRKSLERGDIWGAGAYEALLKAELKSLGSEYERVNFLGALLKDKNPNRSESAAWALASMKDNPAAASVLIDAAKDPGHPAHETAGRVAKRVGMSN